MSNTDSLKKVYIGSYLTRRVTVSKADPTGKKITTHYLKSTNHLMNHSPDGYYWGYTGSGPAQLALSILQEHFNNDEKALKYYQDFKFDVIANLNKGRNFTLSNIKIDDWVKTKEWPLIQT